LLHVDPNLYFGKKTPKVLNYFRNPRMFDTPELDFNVSMWNDWNCDKKLPKLAYLENYLT